MILKIIAAAVDFITHVLILKVIAVEVVVVCSFSAAAAAAAAAADAAAYNVSEIIKDFFVHLEPAPNIGL